MNASPAAHPTNASFNFKGKSALVTGGTSGIGRTTALALARAGASVVITGRRAAEGEAVAEQARGLGVKAFFVQGDISDEAHVQNAVAQAVKLGGGRLDFALNNAGLELSGVELKDSTPAQYKQVFDINVLGVLLSLKHEIRAMLANPGGPRGSIVNTSSVAGSVGMASAGVYIASKHAVNGLTKSAALEVAKQNIRVNSVSPAVIETPMFDRFSGNRQPEVVSYMTGLHPIGRFGATREVADPVLFLFSELSTFITGTDVVIDGGFTAQ